MKTTFRFSSLRSIIFICFILLLIAVQSVSFFTNQMATQKLEQQKLSSQLNRAETLLNNEMRNRSYYLTAFAETAAKDYGLKQVLTEDKRSLLVALNNHRKRIDSDIAIALDEQGYILANLVMKDIDKDTKRVTSALQADTQFAHLNWLSNASTANFYAYKQELFQLVLAPIINGDLIIGYVGFGYKLNKTLTMDLADLTQFNVGFAVENTGTWQWFALNDDNYQHDHFSNEDTALNTQFVYANIPLGDIDGKPLFASTFQLRSSLTASIKKDSLQLLLMISITLIISLLGAYFIASKVTQPLRRLVTVAKDIANGNYRTHVFSSNTKELKLIAAQFKEMQQAIQTRENKISQQAYRDSLTLLPNRNQFCKDIENASGSFVLCQINIRRLAEINDTLGHDVGDDVIKEVGSRLALLNSPLYHTSGNCFLIRFNNITLVDIEHSIDSINDVLEANFIYQNIVLHIQTNIGVTSADGSIEANQLLKEVDSAMQLAKRDNLLFQIYDQQIDLNTLDRLQLVNRIKTAIEHNEFTLFFQPKLNLSDNSISEVEALVRWQHPVHGLITPDAFIQITEQTGQMKALSLWVLYNAIEQYYLWQAAGIELKISVNISPENLLDDDFCQLIINKLCAESNLREVIRFEITEDAFIDHNSKAVDNISLLKNKGIHLSIDDYGTGYSSLAQLKNLSVHELKIDKCFIQKLIHEPVDQLIVSSTIKLSHQLGVAVVAEGVEDSKTLDWLKQQKCEKAQGYFISRPMKAKDLVDWMSISPYNITKTNFDDDECTESNISLAVDLVN